MLLKLRNLGLKENNQNYMENISITQDSGVARE